MPYTTRSKSDHGYSCRDRIPNGRGAHADLLTIRTLADQKKISVKENDPYRKEFS